MDGNKPATLRQEIVQILQGRGYGLNDMNTFLRKWANDNKVPTKRELFAAMAMQGFCSWDHSKGEMACYRTSRAYEAVMAADALIAELAKEQK